MGCKHSRVFEDEDERVATHTGGCYPPEIFFENQCILEKYQCPIMWGVLNNPLRGKCGHVFCDHCINTTLKVDDRRRCPVCRQELGKLVKNIPLKKKIENLFARCPNVDCGWSGSLKGLQQHLKKSCNCNCEKQPNLDNKIVDQNTEQCRLRSLQQISSKEPAVVINLMDLIDN